MNDNAWERYRRIEARGELGQDANYSQASDIFSFAVMCQRDFNLPKDAGFGVLELCLTDDPDARPSLNETKACLKLDYLLTFKAPISTILEEITTCIQQIPKHMLPVVIKDKRPEILSALAPTMLATINELKHQCMSDYRHMHGSMKGTLSRTKASSLANFSEVVTYGQRYLKRSTSPLKLGVVPGKRSAAILIRMGVLERNGDLSESFKQLHELEIKLQESLQQGPAGPRNATA